jgi:hypothetical protein
MARCVSTRQIGSNGSFVICDWLFVIFLWTLEAWMATSLVEKLIREDC